MSLRGRLLLALGALALAALVAADVATWSALRSFLLTRVDQTLQAAVGPLAHSLGPAGGHGGIGEPPGDQPPPVGQVAPATFVERRSPSGSVLYTQPAYERGGVATSPALPAHVDAPGYRGGPGPAAAAFFDAGPAAVSQSDDRPSFRVLATTLAGGDQLILAAPLTETTGTIDRLVVIEVAVTTAAVVMMALVGWWLVSLGLKPLREIERTAGEIAAGRLGERVPGDDRRTELGRLAGALNVMLGWIEGAFAQRDATETTLGASWPTPPTSCAPRWRRCPPTPSCSSGGPRPAPPTWPGSCAASGARAPEWAAWSRI